MVKRYRARMPQERRAAEDDLYSGNREIDDSEGIYGSNSGI
jgi:hypothetical protein